MNNELERLRDVVRALVVESQAWSAFRNWLSGQTGKELASTEEGKREAYRFSGVVQDSKREVDRAMVRLAEVNPELVAGYQPRVPGPPDAGGSDPKPNPPAV